MKLILVWCFQSTQKPGICNLVSLLYSCLWLSVCGVWIINRRARKTPSMVCCGLRSVTYTSGVASLLQTKERWQYKAL